MMKNIGIMEETMDYICKKCNKKDFANSIQQVIQRRKLCFECMMDERKKPTTKKDSKKVLKTKMCTECEKEFTTTGKSTTCSKECRKHKVENTRFRNNLAKANKIIDASKVEVYQFGSSRYNQDKIHKDI